MPEKPKVYIQTFYGFDVFVNGRVIYFPSKKSKELLAILVNQRGGSVSLAQVVHILYENLKESTAKRNIRVVYHRLRKTLEEYGCEEMLIHKRGIFSIHTEWFECDLYEFVKGNEAYLTAYTGTYMAEYPWASATIPYLDTMYARMNDNDKTRREVYSEEWIG